MICRLLLVLMLVVVSSVAPVVADPGEVEPAPAAGGIPDFDAAKARLATLGPELIARYKLTDAEIGICIVRAADGETVFALNAETPRAPASNAKLLTTVAAYQLLGPDYVWRTSVHLVAGALEADTWTGNLLVIGRGDPNLSGRAHDGRVTAEFESWADRILAAGVKHIAGDLLLDDLFFDRVYVPPSWPDDQLQNWYCAPVSALALNDNCVDVTVLPGPKGGAPARITLAPDTRTVTITNQCKTVLRKKQHSFQILRAADGNSITVKGGYLLKGGGYTESIAVCEPVRWFGAVLKETLTRKGVTVDGEVKLLDQPLSPAPDEATAVAASASGMALTVQVTNQRSQNFYAEQIFKTLGAVKHGQGTIEHGQACVREALLALDIPAEQFTIVDGCGLAAGNRVSASALTRVLGAAWRAPWSGPFVASLAIGGEAGTLEKRFRDKACKGKVRGKTGYISGVSALSGYVETTHHGAWAFSILVNKFKTDLSRVRAFQDELVRACIE